MYNFIFFLVKLTNMMLHFVEEVVYLNQP